MTKRNSSEIACTVGAQFTLPPLQVGNGFECDAEGLIWRDKNRVERRATIDQIQRKLKESLSAPQNLNV